jgi:hypothetical protein
LSRRRCRKRGILDSLPRYFSATWRISIP